MVRRTPTGLVLVPLLALTLGGCAGWGAGGSDDPDSINVLMVNNPQMVDLQQLTAENFTAETGITVNFTVLPENDVRDKISQEFSSQAGQYDVATVSNFEIPIYARSRWIAPLDAVHRPGRRASTRPTSSPRWPSRCPATTARSTASPSTASPRS